MGIARSVIWHRGLPESKVLSKSRFQPAQVSTVKALSLHSVVAYSQRFAWDSPAFFLFIRPPYVRFFLTALISRRTPLIMILSRITLLASVSGLCCYILTLYLVRPVARLGRMTEQLAVESGNPH